MKNVHNFLILIFIGALVFLIGQKIYISDGSFDIIGLELADASHGAAIVKAWSQTPVDDVTLLHYALVSTYVDFIFIIGYTGVLIIISYYLMQRERDKNLNDLLRFCFGLAILAGVLDVIENIILLYNMHHFKFREFITSMYVSYPKWILVGVIILIWVSSIVNRLTKKL